MKDFRTKIEPLPSKNKITYNTPALFLGSCFSENIGYKMEELKFQTLVNPFGVLYNPVSVRSGLEILIDHKKFQESDLNFFNEQWYSFFHDTEFSDVDKLISLEKINSSIHQASEFLIKSNYLIITFGTAWVYKYLNTGQIVSNCHKIPAKEFERFRLEPETIFMEWSNLINRLNQLNKKMKIIFTVSPVRHWKDGAVENQLSKSTLILSIHQLKRKFENIEYFPSYEIIMDDLRDYRFYADDMLHPSNLAIEYIWRQFDKTYFDNKTREIATEVEKIIRAKNHKPLHPQTNNYKKFRENHIRKINELVKKYPFLDFNKEAEYFSE